MIYGYARVSTDGQSLDTQVTIARRRTPEGLSGNGERAQTGRPN